MIKTNLLIKRASYVLAVLAVAIMPLVHSTQASAAQLTARSVTIGTSAPSTATTYAFAFTFATSTAIKSAEFTACTTASGACTTPAGFVNSASTLTGQPTGFGAASGWTVSTATAGSLRLANAANATVPSGNQTVSFSNVTNPSATNSTFFLRATTYSGAAWATPIDTGNVAASTAGQVTVNATVDETLTFTLASATVTLTTPTTSATGTGTSTMSASTNAASGYSITVAGSTLTGPSTLTAMAGAASATNTKQFGLNLVSNTTPSVGTAVSGSGSGTANVANGYGTADSFKFVSGNTVASAAAPTNTNTFTVSYIANIDGSTLPGAYSTVLTYVATPNF